MAEEKQVKARVLVAIRYEEELHQPNTVISAPASVIKGWHTQGSVDPHEDAVAYAEDLNAKAATKAKAAADEA